MVASGGHVRLIGLQVAFNLDKALENGSNLGAGGGVSGAQGAVCVAAHQGRAGGPLHSLEGPGADVVLVRGLVQELVACRQRVVPLEIVEQNKGGLFAGDVVVGAEFVVAKAVDKLVLRGPGNVRLGSVLLHVAEGAGVLVLALVDARDTAQDRDEHGAGSGLVGAELAAAGAGHIAVFGHVGDRLVEPGVLRHIGEAGVCRERGHRKDGQDSDEG